MIEQKLKAESTQQDMQIEGCGEARRGEAKIAARDSVRLRHWRELLSRLIPIFGWRNMRARDKTPRTMKIFYLKTAQLITLRSLGEPCGKFMEDF